MMLLLVGFFTWLALRRGTLNDDRIAQGLKPMEEDEAHQKVMVWPDLVYIEFICLILISAGLLVWSLAMKAPLEQPATRVDTPNPSKAPWYFLGLQELLVYFDPWIAGVLLPGIVIGGLIAIPYIDNNPKGQGYYTLRERRFAISMFLYGFLILWVVLINVGTFLRGPNWNIFPLGDVWDVHKIEVLNNVNLSEYFWVLGMGQPLPAHWFVRELPGFILVGGYLVLGPAILAKTLFKKMYQELGFVRYSILVMLFLLMLSVVLKMVLRWSFNLKYFVAIPEFFFNI
ncbi:MAG: cytochrome C [Planctomycetes bacterium]|nr:cytochrome C [Planctomycetota bacterium]